MGLKVKSQFSQNIPLRLIYKLENLYLNLQSDTEFKNLILLHHKMGYFLEIYGEMAAVGNDKETLLKISDVFHQFIIKPVTKRKEKKKQYFFCYRNTFISHSSLSIVR